MLIREVLSEIVVGQDVGAIDLSNDRMWRGTLSFGNEALTARAVAGVDLALCADANGLPFCLHTGVKDLYGQHFTAAMPNTPLIEFYQGTYPGVPFELCHIGSPVESNRPCYRPIPGTQVPVIADVFSNGNRWRGGPRCAVDRR